MHPHSPHIPPSPTAPHVQWKTPRYRHHSFPHSSHGEACYRTSTTQFVREVFTVHAWAGLAVKLLQGSDIPHEDHGVAVFVRRIPPCNEFSSLSAGYHPATNFLLCLLVFCSSHTCLYIALASLSSSLLRVGFCCRRCWCRGAAEHCTGVGVLFGGAGELVDSGLRCNVGDGLAWLNKLSQTKVPSQQLVWVGVCCKSR
jgi:hypothetical protein